MSWAKLDDGLHDHPKVDAMLEADELRGAAALGLWSLALSFSADQLTDGQISRRAVARLMPGVGVELASHLVAAGLWDVTQAGWAIHDYLDFNPSREDVLKARRADAARKKAARDKLESERMSGRTATGTAGRTTSRHSAAPSDVPSVGSSAEIPGGRPGTPTRPDPTPPKGEGSPVVSGRANAVNGRTASLADRVTGVLQRGIDGLTTDEGCKPPSAPRIAALLAEADADEITALGVAAEVRSITQAQNRAPNVEALYAQRLNEALTNPTHPINEQGAMP